MRLSEWTCSAWLAVGVCLGGVLWSPAVRAQDGVSATPPTRPTVDSADPGPAASRTHDPARDEGSAVPSDRATVQSGGDPDATSSVPSQLATMHWDDVPDEPVMEPGSDDASPAPTTGPTPAPVHWQDDEQIVSGIPWTDQMFRIGGRVIAGFAVRDRRPAGGQGGNPGTSYGFVLQQARVRTELRPNKRLRLVVSADFADGLDPADVDPPPYIRNAYLQYTVVDRYLQVRAGRYKRPFSGMELRNTGQLPFRGRGLANGLIVERGQWGDRAVGVMLRGEVETAGVKYFLSVSDPEWRVRSEPQGLDLLGRVTWDVIDELRLGISGGHKWTESATDDLVKVLGFTADARLDLDDFELLAEVLVGQQAQVTGQPVSMGVVGAASYSIRLAKSWKLQPVVFGEWADADIEFSGNDAVRAVFGLNVLWKKSLRLMTQLEMIRPLGTVTALNPWPASDRLMVVLAAEM